MARYVNFCESSQAKSQILQIFESGYGYYAIISRLTHLEESMKLIITSEQSSLGCLAAITQQVENSVVLQEDQILRFNSVLHRNQVGGKLVYFLI